MLFFNNTFFASAFSQVKALPYFLNFKIAQFFRSEQAYSNAEVQRVGNYGQDQLP